MGTIAKAFDCFVGAWGYINATLTNTTTGELIPEWHSPHPSGISVYSPSGYLSFIITANDTTEPEKRPTTVSLPAQPDDSVGDWATVAQYSLGVGGSFAITDITDAGGNGNGNGTYGNGSAAADGPFGVVTSTFTTATLPAWVGFELPNEFGFYGGCDRHFLRTNLAEDAVQLVWFYRLPDNRPS